MKRKLFLGILITFLVQKLISGQIPTYTVEKAAFSSDVYDEFSPVYYKNGIVFCSNRNSNLVFNYLDSENKGPFKIYYVDTTGEVTWQKSTLLSRSLTTKFNDGPATFDSSGDTIYYSRNLKTDGKLKELSGVRNKLGIFSATLEGKNWTKIREFRFNNEWYNVSTPCLSPDGTKLYFASDKPDGYGGSDLYVCQWKNDYWDNPVNLGPKINTEGNEAYPFINASGELFFSSDGHSGLGGKDIFFSKFVDSTWVDPVPLDAPINSTYDDFGFICDSMMNEGYFSSKRDKTIDIFHFRTNFPQIFYSKPQKENHYCYNFSDNGLIVVDTLNLIFVWDFGDGKKISGAEVSHCFPGSGKYFVKLDIFDRSKGNLFFPKLAYYLNIREYEQTYINSPDFVVKGDSVDYDGLRSNLPGYKILNYSWYFSDGSKVHGPKVRHAFKEKGEYTVNLGLTIRSDSTLNISKTGCSKNIVVFNDLQEKANWLAKISSAKSDLPDVKKYENALINLQYSAESDFKQDAVFIVEILSSKSKIGIYNSIFRDIPVRYKIKENFDPESNTFSYTVDQQMDLMSTYVAYKDMLALGYKDVRTKIVVLKDPAEKDLRNLVKIYTPFADSYFDASEMLTSNAYIMLDQIVKLMNRYPLIKLEVAVHTDNIGSAEYNLVLTQKRAQLLSSYLINRGIESKRVKPKGYGQSKPIASNLLEKGRRLNRRIDFIIMNQ